MLVSVISGIILIFVGIGLSRPLLELMGTPADVIDQSVLYMRIYFVGMPVMMLYNFGSAILRAVGDTQRPLYFLLIAGVINVLLNLLFVIVFPHGRGGRGHPHGDFPVRFRHLGAAVPGEERRGLPRKPERASHLQREAAAND